MLTISTAKSVEDFDAAEQLCTQLGLWDAALAPRHGLTPSELLAAFYDETRASLVEKFSSPDSGFMIAWWNGIPAGSLAFDAFDDATAELHRFYVHVAFRGKGIGRRLMRTVLGTIDQGARRRVLAHTTPYMTHAVAIYEAFGFRPCARFRETPERIRPTDLFMDRTR